MGEQMSGWEFSEWQLLYDREQLHPAQIRARHAQVLAAVMQGQSTRKDGQAWSAKHFMPADPWAAAPAPQPVRRLNVVQQVRELNARRRRK